MWFPFSAHRASCAPREPCGSNGHVRGGDSSRDGRACRKRPHAGTGAKPDAGALDARPSTVTSCMNRRIPRIIASRPETGAGWVREQAGRARETVSTGGMTRPLRARRPERWHARMGIPRAT